MPKERPILFNGPIVRAIIEGRKTMTRMVIKPQPKPLGDDGRRTTYLWRDGLYALRFYPDRSDILKRCPYGQPGDRLWVRETWAALGFSYDWETGHCDDVFEVLPEDVLRTKQQDDEARKSMRGRPRHGIVYGANLGWESDRKDRGFAWLPSIHMPRWASRLTLEVASVRVERLQDISNEDAEREGVGHIDPGGMLSFREHFQELWSSVNLKSGYGWDANPWVWVIEFKKV